MNTTKCANPDCPGCGCPSRAPASTGTHLAVPVDNRTAAAAVSFETLPPKEWYSITKGLDVGVRHTWFVFILCMFASFVYCRRLYLRRAAAEPLVTHPDYNIRNVESRVFRSEKAAKKHFAGAAKAGKVEVLDLATVGRPKH
jgi:hypothetical protein